MKIGYKNVIEYATLESSDTMSGFSVESIKTASTKDVFIAQSKTATIRVSLLIPAFLQHFYMHSNITPGEGSVVMNVYSDHTFSTITNTIDLGSNKHGSVEVTAQYIDIVASNETIGVPALTVGHLYLGEVVSMPPVSSGASLAFHTTDSRVLSISGQVYGTRGYTYRQPTFRFKNLSFEQMEDIKTVFESVTTVNPVWLSIWDDYEPLYVVIENPSIEFTESETQATWSCEFTAREVF